MGARDARAVHRRAVEPGYPGTHPVFPGRTVLTAEYCGRDIMRRVVTFLAFAAVSACAKRPTPTPVSAASASASATASASSAVPVVVDAAVDAMAPDAGRLSPLSFVGETAPRTSARTFRLPSGLALAEAGEKTWKLYVVGSRGALTIVDALLRTPESHQPLDVVAVHEMGTDRESELWLSLEDHTRAPTILRVSGARVTRVPQTGSWVRALARLDSGDVIALTSSHQDTGQLIDDDRQSFERLRGTSATLPIIPDGLRLYDVDVLPNGEVHALGARLVDGGLSTLGWIAPPGKATRTFEMPPAIGLGQPTLIRGGTQFLAGVVYGIVNHDGHGFFIGERGGRAVLAKSAEYTAAAVGPGGEVWIAEHVEASASRIVRARIDFTRGAVVEAAASPFPNPTELEAQGATSCRHPGNVDDLVALATGVVLASVSCADGAEGVFRTTLP